MGPGDHVTIPSSPVPPDAQPPPATTPYEAGPTPDATVDEEPAAPKKKKSNKGPGKATRKTSTPVTVDPTESSEVVARVRTTRAAKR